MHPSYLFPLYCSSPANLFFLGTAAQGRLNGLQNAGSVAAASSSPTPSPQAVQRPVGLWYSVASRRTTLATVLSNRPMVRPATTSRWQVYHSEQRDRASMHPSRALTAVQVELRPPSSPSAAPIEHPHKTACSTWLQLHRGPAPLVFHSATGRQAWMPSSEPPHCPAATLLQPPSGGARCSKHVLWMPPPLAYSLRSARPSPFFPVHPA
ncbi:uncharacterized protein [Aegilops tauschii subsp. strangulata]|uniref:uncharacterized protein n=1 Tax=Aegilops tauschii subsp. strangulata TaxID=200361 RepID=UPI00098B4004|nr:uncharacterized protein LOC109763639 isoform X2 [Aegilops tauschii subsp. strangulata]